jgi:ferredoxin
MIEKIRSQVAEQLQELDGVVGLQQTSQGTAPFLFRDGDDLTQLVVEPRYPMAEILSKLQKQFRDSNFGIVARGCDLRAIVEMTKRLQIDPDRLYLIGFTCSTEQAKICHCADPFPNIEQWPNSEMIGELVPGEKPNPLVEKFRRMSREDRRMFWQQQFQRCIKCYGCRDICPVCFCEACSLEDPKWVEPGLLAPEFPTFHLIKAIHMTTRCIACRQCELACPADIPLTVLYDLIREDVNDLIGYFPGADREAAPPLSLTLSDAPIKSDLV